MSFIKSVYVSPVSDSSLYPEFHTCGTGGGTVYANESHVSDNSEINFTSPVNFAEDGVVTTKIQGECIQPVKRHRIMASSLYPEFYTCGTGGGTFYVNESYISDNSEINSTSPVNFTEDGMVTTKMQVGYVQPVKK